MNYYIWIFFFGDLATANHWFCECTVLFHVISFRNKQPKKGCHWCYNCGCCSSFDCNNCVSVLQRTWHRDCWDSGVSVVTLVPNQSQSCISVTCDAFLPQTPNLKLCETKWRCHHETKISFYFWESLCMCNKNDWQCNKVSSQNKLVFLFVFFFIVTTKSLVYIWDIYTPVWRVSI